MTKRLLALIAVIVLIFAVSVPVLALDGDFDASEPGVHIWTPGGYQTYLPFTGQVGIRLGSDGVYYISTGYGNYSALWNEVAVYAPGGQVFESTVELINFSDPSGHSGTYKNISIENHTYVYELDDSSPFWSVRLTSLEMGDYLFFSNPYGEPVPSIIVSGGVLPELPVPTRQGNFVFGGWWDQNFVYEYSQGDPFTPGMVLHALWIGDGPGYTVSFDTTGGSSIATMFGITVLPDPLPEPVKIGSRFFGWFYAHNDAQAHSGDVISADVVLRARWTAVKYSLTFKSGDTTIRTMNDLTMIPASLPTLQYSDSVFVGWYYDQQFTDPVRPGDPLFSNEVIYARLIPLDNLYEDGYQQGIKDTQSLKVVINSMWEGFHTAFSSFINQSSVGGLSLSSVLITLSIILVAVIVFKVVV